MAKIKITEDERFPNYRFTELPETDGRFADEEPVEVPRHIISLIELINTLYDQAQDVLEGYYKQSQNNES